MEQLLLSCDQAVNFPRNVIHCNAYKHALGAYVKRLDEKQLDLFSDEDNASLDLMEYDVQRRKNCSTLIYSLQALKDHVHASASNPDSSCRFVFLAAPHSRERLYTSRKLLTYVLSYYQVMPSFLDFLFAFGRQEHACDLNFSGFRQESRLHPMYSCLQVPELGRSGRELRVCYNLKSVEPSTYQPHMPWSIRQAAVYHSLDLITGNSFWIVTKGDELIRERINDSMQPCGLPKELGILEPIGNALVSSLDIHMIICEWCSEHWRWYISYLEEMTREKTGDIFALIMEPPQIPVDGKLRNPLTWRPVLSTANEKKSWRPKKFLKVLPNSSKLRLNRSTGQPATSPLPPAAEPSRRSNTGDISFRPHSISPKKFSLLNFREIQSIEDRANEILLVLESDISVLTKLQEHYITITQSKHCPQDLIRDCGFQLEKFENKLSGIISDLHMQHSRATTLLRLLADRKNLFQDMEVSKDLAFRAQESAKTMELITKDMHTLALKTKSETVSMRIITLVTLFFLPGTFISTQKVFQLGALQLFLAICLPMMIIVLMAWYGTYWWIERKEVESQQHLEIGSFEQA
ncbi:hypothetical protein BDZ45DRAFT_732967 [Acephala macrosclerotiorum]|nr:hypothetical protein BDZ45DRAFT_732967 [Acephala macrosclerotiorum]